MKQDHDSLVEEQRRDLELGAALAALPHPELPDDIDARLRAAVEMARRRRRRLRSVATIALAAALAALALGGAALAGAFDSDSPAPWPEPPLPAGAAYPTNAAGQTYGGGKALVEEPDLVKVIATNGKHGYCLKSDFDGPRITPSTPPEEVEEMNERGLRGHTIPVYESDGVTQIGVFQIGGPGTTMFYGSADGGKVTKTADADLNITTTTTHPDGTVTVETEALDGTITTKTYEHESDVPKVESPRVTVSAAPKPEPHKPQAWLLGRMSQLAGEAGDAHATAWWELQTRHYLKPIEGDKTPESPYQQWATVWLVILHGDFVAGDWRYWLLDQDSHNVLSSGQSDTRFVMSGPQLPPPQGPITLGEK